MLYTKTNSAILALMGERLKEYRLRSEMRHKDLALHAGVSVTTIGRAEKGLPISSKSLVAILRSLQMLENIELLIPEPPISPRLIREWQETKKKRIKKPRHE